MNVSKHVCEAAGFPVQRMNTEQLEVTSARIGNLGLTLSLWRNPKYWPENRRPTLPELLQRITDDDRVRIRALVAF